MARFWFGDSDDWSLSVGVGGVLKLSASTRKYYDAETGGSQHTDLLIGGTTPASEVAGSGLPVRFKGPDGVSEMWESANDGPRALVVSTDLGDTVADLAEQVEQHAADVLEVVATTSGVVAGAISTPGPAKDALSAAYGAKIWVNVVQDFGADNTGATDAGPAINNAIAYLKALGGGGTVYLPRGTYKILTTIDLSNIHPAFTVNSGPSIRFMGGGKYETILTGGEAGYGFLELVGSNRLMFQGFEIFATTSGVKTGILGGRKAGDASSGEHTFRDIIVHGAFDVAGVFVMSSELGDYEDILVYTTSGRGMVLARDRRGWTTTEFPSFNAKYTALSTTTAIAGGNGNIKLSRVSILCNGTTAADVPLTWEYSQAGIADHLYTYSNGAPFQILLQKKIHSIAFRGLTEEWGGGTPATAPLGIYAANVVNPGEQQDVCITIADSRALPVYSEDGVVFVDFQFDSTEWRDTNFAYQFDVDVSYNARIHYDPRATSIRGEQNPQYRKRSGGGDNQRYPNSFTTVNRPSASSLGQGETIFDTTLGIPLWSNGSLWLDASGIDAPVRTVASNYTMTATDSTVLINGAGLTISLPDPTAVQAGRTYRVKNLNASVAIVNSAGTSKTIDGVASMALAQYGKLAVVSNGTTWLTVVGPSLPAEPDALTAGQITPARGLITSTLVAPTSGTLVLNFLTADKTEVVSTLTAYTGGTGAAATPTVIRYGLYELAANGDGTLVASTPNDTTLLAAANTAYAKALSSSFTKIAGKRYAVALLVVTAAAMPTFTGAVPNSTTPIGAILGAAPRLCGRLTSQTDLPASFTEAGLAGYQLRPAILMS